MEATRKYLAIIFPNHQYSPEFSSFPNTISSKAQHQAPRLQERTEKLRKCPSLRFNKQISLHTIQTNHRENLQYQLACSAYTQFSLIQQPSLKSLDPSPPLFL